MRNVPIATEVRQRLVRAGFSRRYASRAARELREHWEDLVEESLRQGMSRADAEAHASLQLGAAPRISDELSERLRESSWLGRNPTFGFMSLAIVTTFVWWAILMMAAGAATGLWTWEGNPTGNVRGKIAIFSACTDWIRSLSYVSIPALLCFVAQRYGCGWKPALWGCLTVAIHNATHFFRLSGPPGNASMEWGYSFSTTGPELLPIITPLGVFLLFCLWRRRPQPADEDPSDFHYC
jgi:hypothetical protein